MAPDAASGQTIVRVTGLASRELSALRGAMLTGEAWRDLLHVSVTGTAGIAVAGRYEAAAAGVEFRPTFPFDPGRSYTVRFDAARLPTPRASAVIETLVSVPRAALSVPTVVTAIYPSSDRWPANLLRFYIHFSAPMSRVSGVGLVHLMDANGEEVPDALLHTADVDFWNENHTRYTVFFDPGRVKRGILPNRQMGRALVSGRRYTVAVDAAWKDGNGRPLREAYRHGFVAGPAIERPINFNWKIAPPKAGTSDPVVVVFPDALDHALLLRAVGVTLRGEKTLMGTVAIGRGETEWRFTPPTRWVAGAYDIVALSILEDPAGNRIDKPFEVAPASPAKEGPSHDEYRIPFEIR